MAKPVDGLRRDVTDGRSFSRSWHTASIVPKSSFFQLLFLLAELIPSEFL